MESRNLVLWGNDLEDMLVDKVRGNNDSWAVFWALTVIEKEGVCVRSSRALIKNIGFDGSGTHSGKTNIYDTERNSEVIEYYNLPEGVGFLEKVKYEYASLNP